MIGESGNLMKGKSRRLFWFPAAVLALFLILKDVFSYFQGTMAYSDPPHPLVVIISSVVWALAFAVVWAAAFVLLAVKANRKAYMAAFLVLAAAALINFIPGCLGGSYMTYAMIAYQITFPLYKIAAGAAAAVCLIQIVSYCVLLFYKHSNVLTRVGSAIATLCALLAMALDLLSMTAVLFRVAPALAPFATYVIGACNMCAALSLLAAIGGVCFGKPGGKTDRIAAAKESTAV